MLYWNAALRMLDSLSSPAYLDTADTSPGILLHGVGNLPAGQEEDVSLIYGDYYFLEAVRRFPPGGTELLLAERFAFRTGSEPIDDLGQLTLKSTSGGEFWVASHTSRSAPNALSPAPGEEPIPAPAE